MTTEQTSAVSFNPDDASAGGFLNDIDATIVKAEVVSYDYNGKTQDGEPVCCLAITYRPFDAESDEDQSIDYIKLGKMTEIVPSKDNKSAVPITKTKFHVKSKIMAFWRAAVEAGFPKNKVGTDVSVLDGLHVHLISLVVPGNEKDGIKDSKLTVFAKILDKGPSGTAVKGGAKPGAAKSTKAAAGGGTTSPAPAAAAAAAPAAAVDADVETEAITTLLTILEGKGGKVAKSSLPGEVFRRIKDTAIRNAVLKIVNSNEWLGAEDRPWSFEGGELTART